MEASASNAFGTIRLRANCAYSEEVQQWLQETVDLIAKEAEAKVRDAVVRQAWITDIYGVAPKLN